MKVLVLVGTRPEVIKQVPLFWALRDAFGEQNVTLGGTGQHRELLDQALQHFSERLAFNLGVMRHGASLSESASLILAELGSLFNRNRPDLVIVQGDTTTAAMASIAAFHHRALVAHNEAGLRSHNMAHPFPEEANRKIISAMANYHFAPTPLAFETLLTEGIPRESILLTGNTGIDALFWTLKKPPSEATKHLLGQLESKGRKPVLLTAHRRENEGESFTSWLTTVATFFKKNPQLHLVFPLHPNNLARAAAQEFIGSLENATLCDPLSYLDTCHILNASHFAVTDSGGIQEEAASLGVPCIVCRQTTERREAVIAGISKLADPLKIQLLLDSMNWANSVSKEARETAKRSTIFGDGSASRKISNFLKRQLLPNS